ncbi:MAG: RHS repeat-associated core domain-containing protein [Candidatus Obscuribacter sp.]|nr:RHS repeat-associated core domain-containing protein [Candidatus Obscuribacter sp.]MBK9280952.1 RHS repeat-associated core domain-containing protein [Candidatus Obscuribacter sp.]
MVTRSGATVTLTFDELNRVKTKTPSGQPTVTTVYDIAGRVVTVSTPVVAGDPSSGTFTNFYDTAGRFYREQYPDGLSVTHQLDANGNLTRTIYPDGYFIDRVFDQLNRLTDIKLNGAGTSSLQFQYDALSRRTKLIYENGCSTGYGFEQDNDLNGLLHNFVGSNVNFSYAFDTVGQMLSQRTSDPANFRWTPGAPGTVSYGTANNINQYPTVGGIGFSYSTDGNLTNDGVFKYEFNSERMMTRVRDAGTNAIVADYLYDPALRQRQKNVGGTKTNFYYSGWQRLADYDGTANTLQQRFVYGSGLDEVLIQISSGGTKTYFHGNHQGSVIATTDASGAVLNRFKYSPYGESPSMSGTSHGYTGQRYDSETGLYYYKMRQYSPKLGRFLQADPVGYGAGLNMYAYGGNNPTAGSDPMGLTFGATWGSAVYQAYLQGQGIIPPPGDYVAPPSGATNSASSSSPAFGAGSASSSAKTAAPAFAASGFAYDLLTQTQHLNQSAVPPILWDDPTTTAELSFRTAELVEPRTYVNGDISSLQAAKNRVVADATSVLLRPSYGFFTSIANGQMHFGTDFVLTTKMYPNLVYIGNFKYWIPGRDEPPPDHPAVWTRREVFDKNHVLQMVFWRDIWLRLNVIDPPAADGTYIGSVPSSGQLAQSLNVLGYYDFQVSFGGAAFAQRTL